MADQVFLTIEDFDGDPQTTSIAVRDIADQGDFCHVRFDGRRVADSHHSVDHRARADARLSYCVNEQLPGAAASQWHRRPSS
jgi:hypothetical protein